MSAVPGNASLAAPGLSWHSAFPGRRLAIQVPEWGNKHESTGRWSAARYAIVPAVGCPSHGTADSVLRRFSGQHWERMDSRPRFSWSGAGQSGKSFERNRLRLQRDTAGRSTLGRELECLGFGFGSNGRIRIRRRSERRTSGPSSGAEQLAGDAWLGDSRAHGRASILPSERAQIGLGLL